MKLIFLTTWIYEDLCIDKRNLVSNFWLFEDKFYSLLRRLLIWFEISDFLNCFFSMFKTVLQHFQVGGFNKLVILTQLKIFRLLLEQSTFFAETIMVKWYENLSQIYFDQIYHIILIFAPCIPPQIIFKILYFASLEK